MELPDKHTILDKGHVQKQFHYDLECRDIKGSNSKDSYCKVGRDQASSSISVKQIQWLCKAHHLLSQQYLKRRQRHSCLNPNRQSYCYSHYIHLLKQRIYLPDIFSEYLRRHRPNISFQKGINTSRISVMSEIFAPSFRLVVEVGK